MSLTLPPAFATFAGFEFDTNGTSDDVSAGFVVAYLLVVLVVAVLSIVGLWKTFQKAGIEGWWAIIPFANLYHVVKMSGKEWWWFLLLFIPCVNIVAAIVVSLAVAERFNKSPAFGIGVWLLPMIFYLILGFGDAEYEGQPAR